MDRRSILLGLVVLLLYQSSGYYCAFLGQYGLHKAWAKEKTQEEDEERLTFLHLSAADYQALVWVEDQEFWYEGVMHDLKAATRLPNGDWQLRCFRDERETQLLAQAGEVMQADHGEEKGSTSSPALWLPCPCIPPSRISIPIAPLEHRLYPDLRATLSQCVREIPVPPPQQG